MTKTLAAPARLLIAFVISAPTLLAVFWLFQNGFPNVGAALFFVLFFADFLVFRQRPTPSSGSQAGKINLPSRAVWVVGIGCFLGSLSLLSGGIRTHEIWEIVLGSFGMLTSGLGVVYFGRR